MENAANHSVRQQAFDHLNNIIETQSRLAKADFDLDGFMNLVVEQMMQLTPATGVVVELVEGDEMVYRAATGTVKDHVGLHIKRHGSISGLCVEVQQVLRSDDTEKDVRVNIEACRRVRARSMIVAPLFHEAKAVGVLKILSDQPKGFNEEDVKTLQLMAGLIGSALMHQIAHDTTEKLLDEKSKALEELKAAEEKLKHMAQYDFLTDLPNRRLFVDRLDVVISHVKRKRALCALFFLDIDHFKSINDTLGHAIGDELLKAFAERIKQCIRGSDTLARLGGDEFVILLDVIPEQYIAIQIAEKIILKMRDTFVFQDKKINISTSIGITFFDDDKKSANELLKTADDALYQAKEAGRNNYKVN